jgi:hypothetical protein
MFSRIAWLRGPARWARAGVLVGAGAVAMLGGFAGAPLRAAGETGAPATNAAAGIWCSTLNRRVSASAGEPVKLTAGVGSTQSTPAGARFPIRLAVTVTDAEGNPVAGAPITFSAPVAGASGRFTVPARDPHHDRTRFSHPYRVEVPTDACGIAVAPVFAANHIGGGYVVEATGEHVRPAAFALVNEVRGHSS